MATVHHYFARHPGSWRQELLLGPAAREIDFLKLAGPTSGPSPKGWRARSADACRRSTEEDIRQVAWLNERLAILHRERYGLWARLRRFLFGR